MKELILKDNQIVQLDDDMYDIVCSFTDIRYWRVTVLNNSIFVCGKLRGRNNIIYLSTLFPENYSGLTLTFKDENRLNFQRTNLEWRNRRSSKKNPPIIAVSVMEVPHCPHGGIEIIPRSREGQGPECIFCTRKTPEAYEVCLDLISPTTWIGWKIGKSHCV